MALAKHLCAQPVAGGDAVAVRLALPTTIHQAATHYDRAAFRSKGGVDHRRAMQVDQRAEGRHRITEDGAKEHVGRQLRRQGFNEGGREKLDVRRGRLWRRDRFPDPQQHLRTCQRDEYTSTRGGQRCPPPPGRGEACAPPPGCGRMLRPGGRPSSEYGCEQTRRGGVAAQEKSSYSLSASGSLVDAGPSPSAKPRRDCGFVGLRTPGRCVTWKQKPSFSSNQWTYILLR